jgi:hypothetical protein
MPDIFDQISSPAPAAAPQPDIFDRVTSATPPAPQPSVKFADIFDHVEAAAHAMQQPDWKAQANAHIAALHLNPSNPTDAGQMYGIYDSYRKQFGTAQDQQQPTRVQTLEGERQAHVQAQNQEHGVVASNVIEALHPAGQLFARGERLLAPVVGAAFPNAANNMQASAQTLEETHGASGLSSLPGQLAGSLVTYANPLVAAVSGGNDAYVQDERAKATGAQIGTGSEVAHVLGKAALDAVVSKVFSGKTPDAAIAGRAEQAIAKFIAQRMPEYVAKYGSKAAVGVIVNDAAAIGENALVQHTVDPSRGLTDHLLESTITGAAIPVAHEAISSRFRQPGVTPPADGTVKPSESADADTHFRTPAETQAESTRATAPVNVDRQAPAPDGVAKPAEALASGPRYKGQTDPAYQKAKTEIGKSQFEQGDLIHGSTADSIDSVAKGGLQPSDLSGGVDVEHIANADGKSVGTGLAYAGKGGKEPIVYVMKKGAVETDSGNGGANAAVVRSPGKSYVRPDDIAEVHFADGYKAKSLADAQTHWQEMQKPGEPTPPARAPETPQPRPPEATSARKEWMDKDRETLGLSGPDSPERRSWQQSLSDAKEQGVPARADQIAATVNEHPRSLNDTETAGLVVRAAELKHEHAAALERVRTAPDEATTRSHAAEAERIEQDFDQLSRAIRLSGTEKGRTLAAQKLTIDKNYDLLSVLNRAKAAKGKDLTPEERERLTKTVAEHTKAEAEVGKAETKAKDKMATRAVRDSRSRYEKMTPEEKDAERDALLSQVNNNPSDSASLSKLAGNLGSRPEFNTLDQVSDWVRSKTNGKLGRLDVVDALTVSRKNAKGQIASTLADIKKEARDDKSLRTQIEEIQKHLEDGTLPKAKPGAAEDPRTMIQVLKNFRGMLQDRLRVSPQAKKAALESQIAKLTERIDAGVEPPSKADRVATPLRDDLDHLTFKRDKLRGQIRGLLAAHKPKNIWSHIAEPFNASRSLISSMDFSAVLRQGGFITFAHPLRAAKALGPMLRAFGSEEAAHKIDGQIRNRPNGVLYEKTGLYLAPTEHTTLSAQEEAFMSRWAKRVPLVANSERAYSTFLNKLRADSFDTMVGSLTRNREPTLQEGQAIANFINAATGRGKLGALERAAVPLNTVLFAPRYLASRFQLLSGEPLRGGTGRTRRMIAGEYAQYMIGVGAMYSLAAMAGGSISFDARSSEFGKVKFGKTRIDPLSGLGQVVTLVGRETSGQTKSSTTGKVSDLRGKVKFGGQDPVDVATRFARSKLSPMFSTVVNVVSGTDMIGNKVTPGSVATNLTVPVGFSDVYDAMKEQGVPGGTAAGLVAIFGAGVQTYGRKPPRAGTR